MNAWGHFKTITSHKFLVMKYCFKVGLYKQGFLHDLSKYSPTEFMVGAKYYQGTRSPNNAEREATGVSTSWLHHKGRNKHHFEYWRDIDLVTKKYVPIAMPDNYVIEMFCDRIAASKVYLKDKYTNRSPLDYFINKDKETELHIDTRKKILFLLNMLNEKGEKEVLPSAWLKHE